MNVDVKFGVAAVVLISGCSSSEPAVMSAGQGGMGAGATAGAGGQVTAAGAAGTQGIAGSGGLAGMAGAGGEAMAGSGGDGGGGAGGGPSIEHFEKAMLEQRMWSTITAQGMPTARAEGTVAAAGGKIFTFGARGVRPMNAFDPVSKQWSEVAQPPVEMHHIQAVALKSDIWIVGAFQGNYPGETSLGKAYRYDVTGNVWHEGPALSRPRGSNAAVTYNGKLYMVCGSNGGHTGGFQAWFDELDPNTGNWKQLADAPHARDHIQGAVVGTKLYIAGGRQTETGHDVDRPVPEVDVYDFVTEMWSTLAAKLPTPRSDAASVAIGDWVLIIGGEGARPEAFNEVEGLSTLDGTFSTFNTLVQARHSTGAAWLDGKLYSAQGAGAGGGGPELTSIEIWQ